MFAVPDLFALEPDGVTPRLRNTIVDLTGGWFDPANRGPRWAGWYQVARSPNPFVDVRYPGRQHAEPPGSGGRGTRSQEGPETGGRRAGAGLS